MSNHKYSQRMFVPKFKWVKNPEEKFSNFVRRICVQFLKKFKFLKSIVTQSIEHKFSKTWLKNKQGTATVKLKTKML